MARSQPYRTIQFTEGFLEDLVDPSLSAADRRRILRALRLLDTNERHPSLRVHELRGQQEGVWSASASDELRITFLQLDGGRKLLWTCSRHYQ